MSRSNLLNSITDVPGIRVGHYTNIEAATGCTVVLCEKGVLVGVDIRGGAPGTRETETLRPINLVARAHAILLTGGSAFGLDAATGVMRYLEEQGYGFDLGIAKVPIVPAAVLLDLFIGDPRVRPNAEAGYQACLDASDGPVAEGNVGAGTGATVGKVLGHSTMMKGGLGTASMRVGKNVVVGALAAVNAFGDVVDPNTGNILAGTRDPAGKGFADSSRYMITHAEIPGIPARNTTLGVIATNAALDKIQVNKVAQMAHNGLALAVRPAHTMFDGDAVFCLSTGEVEGKIDASIIGAAAVELMSKAIVSAILRADSIFGVPSAKDFRPISP